MIHSNFPTTRPRLSRHLRRLCLPAGLGLVLVAACVPPPPPAPPEEGPQLPLRTVADAAHYRVAAAGTEVYAKVYRGGRLAKLGHNHVVLFKDVRGDIFLADDTNGSLFDLVVSAAGAEVDPPALRQRQGGEFKSQISDNARAGTRANMLGNEVLDAAAYPYVTVSSASIRGPMRRASVKVDVTIRSTTRRMTVPVSLEVDGNRLMASGHFELLQSDFGMEPFSALGGALKVEDRVEVVFTITALKMG